MSEKALAILEDYKSLIRSYRERGEPVPWSGVLFEKLSEKYGLSVNTICNYVYMINGYQKGLKKDSKIVEFSRFLWYNINKIIIPPIFTPQFSEEIYLHHYKHKETNNVIIENLVFVVSVSTAATNLVLGLNTEEIELV